MKKVKKQNIAVIFGGKSAEHDISVITALQCYDALKCMDVHIFKIYISLENKFYLADNLRQKQDYILKGSFEKKLKEIIFSDSYIFVKSGKGFKKFCKMDCIVNCCHGGMGENGELYAILSQAGIKVTSADTLSSKICMSKWLTKEILSKHLPIVEGVLIDENDYRTNAQNVVQNIKQKLGDFVIVKPNHLGSSIGIQKTNTDNIDSVLQAIFRMDNQAVAEKIVPNLKEVNCAVIKDADKLIVSQLESPLLKDEILSFNDKYLSNAKSKGMKGTSREIPARISSELSEKIVKYSTIAYNILGLNGVVRIDFLIDKQTDEVFLNEINTIPGSLAFYLFEPEGIDYVKLLQILIDNAQKMNGNKICYFESTVLG